MGNIRYTVPMHAQGSSPICWMACAEMVAAYKRGDAPSSGYVDPAQTGGSSVSNSTVPSPAATAVEIRTALAARGFVFPTQNASPSGDYLLGLLRSHGPLILLFKTRDLLPVTSTTSAHAVVITGIDTDQGKVWFNNPWGRVDEEQTINAILAAMDRYNQNGWKPVAYLP